MAGKKATETKAPAVIKFGINHVTELVEAKAAKLVIISHDVEPIELVCWLPALCKKKDIPFCIVKSKARLGQLVGQKTCTAACITTVKKEDQKELEVLCESFKAAFNEAKPRWGGGIMGMKSQHIQRRKDMLIERENAKKTGLMA